MIKPRLTVLIAMILAAVASRLAPHPWNLTSITAAALFAGAYFKDRLLAFAVPLVALFLSDVVLGFYREMPVVYLCFALIVGIGMWLSHHRQPALIASASLVSSILFFGLSNFAVWANGSLYPRTLAGLETCYIAAIPFFRNAVEGDLLYCLLLFGGFALLERSFVSLRQGGDMGALKAA